MSESSGEHPNLADWPAEYAYTAGVQAFIYGFPYIYNAQLRHAWVTMKRDPEVVPYAAVNHFWHATRLLDASYRDGGSPSTDTLYSLAWLDLSEEPIILSHPDMGERYFTFQLRGSPPTPSTTWDSAPSDRVQVTSLSPARAGRENFPLQSSGFSQRPRPGFSYSVVPRSTALGSPDARAVQQQYRLTPLSQWGEAGAVVPERREVYAAVPASQDPLGPWKTLNAVLAENPPPEHHAIMLRQFAGIGVGPGLDPDAQPKVVREALVRAAGAGMRLLKQQFLSGDWATSVNGWRYPPAQIGRFGDDFLNRAADQSLAGIAANDAAEAVYLMNFQDAAGDKLSATGRYELHFNPDGLPPVDACWSLAAYSAPDLNPANRYSVGDRTPNLKSDPDGGLTIYLQADSPGPDKESNWLPCSTNGEWFVILRLYRPHAEVVSASWRCPGIIRTN
jgi:hypothetical protein